MIAGLQVFGTDGSLELDITDSLTRELGVVSTGTADGSYYDANLVGGRPWFTVLGDFGNIADFYCPRVTIAGATISWQFEFPYRTAAAIVYGLY